MTARPVPDDRHNSWRDDAACLDHPTEWFTGPHEPGDTRRAIDVCDTCPVKQPCLEAALSIEVSADLGIWGGTTPTTRRRLRRSHSILEQDLLMSSESDPIPKRPAHTSAAEISIPRDDEPGDALELRCDEHGDYVDASGRVIVFEIAGSPPYMVMVDRRPRARASGLREARAIATALIREPSVDRSLPSATSMRLGRTNESADRDCEHTAHSRAAGR